MRPRHVYIHVPFCARRCSYCDFAIAVRRNAPVDEYLSALGAELALRYPHSSPWEVETLYFGGGTPSLLGGSGVRRMLEVVSEHLTPAADAEVTLEANPDDISADSARAWREAGVNRLSIGSQSFHGPALAWMHRTHDSARVAEAVAAARASGIGNISLDLIFSLPESLGRDSDRDLERALELEPSHLSLYGLTVEPSTALAQWRDRGETVEAPEEGYEQEFLAADEALTRAGFEHYEVSNFARAGFRSRHNSSYWTRTPYAGIGPAAHGFDGDRRRWNIAGYPEWVKALRAGLDPVAGEEVLTDANRASEEVYLGLRTVAGVALADGELEIARGWVDAGWGSVERGRLSLTPPGWLRLDSIAAALTDVRSRS